MQEDKSFTITNIDEAKRDAIAITVLKYRLARGIAVGFTDSLALTKARQLADKYGWSKAVRTQKQALEFIEAALKELDDVKGQ